MSSKSDTDNRSNQLNPNNDAYYSSRGSSRYGDDDDEQNYRPPASMACVFPYISETRSATYGFGAVSMSGKAVYATANFHAMTQPFSITHDFDCQYKFEMYLDDFTQLARDHLVCLLGKEEIALFTVFDSSTGRLPWHVHLLPNDIAKTRDGLSLDRCEFVAPALVPLVPESMAYQLLNEVLSSSTGVLPKPSTHKEKKLDPEPFIEALRKTLSSDAMCIGEFQISHTGRISFDEKKEIHYHLTKLRR